MRIAIVGAGAIGGYVGARLAASGNDVALLARGAHLLAIRERGLRVRSAGGEQVVRPFATSDPGEIGTVDAAFLFVKAHSLPEAVTLLGSLLGPDTPVIAGQNGIPWWYFEKHGGPLEGTCLESVDPGGRLRASIPIERVIGAVIYFSTEIEEPGVVRHVEGNRIAIGEPDGSRSRRCEEISRVLQQAGLRCPIRALIRHDIWVKLIGNLALNPISALTRATIEQMMLDGNTRKLVREVMEEGAAVAKAAGVELGISVDRRIEGASRVGPHKTSMLQDLEQGRKLELDCISGAVVELAGLLGVAVPCARTVYVCARLLEESVRVARASSP